MDFNDVFHEIFGGYLEDKEYDAIEDIIWYFKDLLEIEKAKNLTAED